MIDWNNLSWSSQTNSFVLESSHDSNIQQSVEVSEPEPQYFLDFNRPEANADKNGVIHRIKKYYEPRIDLAMKIWKRAVEQAEDVIRPRRNELYQLYHRAMEDDELLQQVRTAHFTIQMSDFKLKRDGKELPELKEYFERPWFDTYQRHAVDAELWGHSLVEFHSKQDENGEFQTVLIVPRIHVRPEYGEVVLMEHDEKGIKYREKPLNKYLIEIGEPFDLGLLKVLSKIVIRKEYALSDWSRRNEKYGMPFMVVRTSTRNKKEIDAKVQMAQNFGSNAWAVLDDLDEVDFKESNQSFAYRTYSDYSDWADKAIAKLVNGQTGTSEEKAFVGSAEVHERILNTYTKARMKRLQNHYTYKLIPFLVKHGYPLEGVKFQFNDLEEDETPDVMDNDEAPQLGYEKKKSFDADKLTAMYTGMTCSHDHHQLALDTNELTGIVERAIKKVYDKKLADGDIDAASWRESANQLWQGTQDGYGKSLLETAYSAQTDWEFLKQLQRNIYVFAAFKNHKAIGDLVKELTDAQGNLRSFEQFKEAVAPITGNYFEDWLRAEYETAVGTGQMSAKWQDFQRNKDVLPFLKYITQRDARVRESHRVLDSVVKHIDDPFWDEFYPPNGWRCRCTVQQVAGGETTDNFLEPNEEQIPPIFRNNPAKTAELFPQNHPYFADMPRRQKEALLRATSELIYDNYDQNWQRLGYDQQSSGYLVAHRNHNPERLPDNKLTGKLLMPEGYAIELLADTAVKDAPDASINGLLWAFATSGSADDVLNDVIWAAQRGNRILVRMTRNVSKGDIENRLRDYAKNNNLTVEVRFTDGDKIKLQ